MAERSIRDFQVPFAVAPLADAWASANGFALSVVEGDVPPPVRRVLGWLRVSDFLEMRIEATGEP